MSFEFGVEIVGFVFALFGVYLASKNNVFTWPLNIIAIICFVWLFAQKKLYGDAVLQGYFFILSIYGWMYWKKNADSHQTIKRFSSTQLLYALLITLALWLPMYYVLNHYTNSDVPIIDSLTTALSFTGQYLLAKKIYQHWFFWIVANSIYVPLLIYKDLYPTALLYFLFLLLSFYGLKEWKKKMYAQTL